jgi:hypothetical protein
MLVRPNSTGCAGTNRGVPAKRLTLLWIFARSMPQPALKVRPFSGKDDVAILDRRLARQNGMIL